MDPLTKNLHSSKILPDVDFWTASKRKKPNNKKGQLSQNGAVRGLLFRTVTRKSSETCQEEAYQESDNVIALLLQPNQDTRGVETSAVGQNHRTFRHDEAAQSNRWGGSGRGDNRDKCC